jgi:hypothetical protein
MKAIFFLAVVLLAGCSAEANDREMYQTKHAYLEVVTLNDGTRCVTAYKGGVDCDWQRP